MLKRLVSNDSGAIARILALDRSVPLPLFQKLLAVAEGQLLVEVLLNRAPIFRELEKAPIATQRAALKATTIPVVVDFASKKVVNVPIDAVEAKHIPQVLRKGVLQDAEAQIQAEEAVRARASKIASSTVPWELIGKGVLRLRRPEVLTKASVVRIIKAIGFTKAELIRIAKDL